MEFNNKRYLIIIMSFALLWYVQTKLGVKSNNDTNFITKSSLTAQVLQIDIPCYSILKKKMKKEKKVYK